MILLPAVDILEGKAVRLARGEFDQRTVYDADPFDAARRVAEAVRGSYTYSGGVSSLDDLRALVDLRQVNLSGVIVGKALFERKFTVAEGQAVLDGH